MSRRPRRLLSTVAAGLVAVTIGGILAVPQALAASAPSGWSPAQVQDAYEFPSATSGSLETVAIVTAYNDPDAASDLAAYRAYYGLPACTAAGGCLAAVGQDGGATLPATGWDDVHDEALDAVSAVCPNCDLLLVEASSDSVADLAAAADEAATLGARFVVNAWDIPEATLGSAETGYDHDFDHPGVVETAPAGDSGYGVSYPAASPYVVAVGGTILTQDTSAARGWTEAAWAGTGAGCSAYEARPSWQSGTGCTMRSDNDTAAVATNVAYYDSDDPGGWAASASTIVSASVIAAAYALAGTPGTTATEPAQYLYGIDDAGYATPGTAYPYAAGLNDITSGSDATACTSYLCGAGAGYDGPTGVGTPYSVAALAPGGAGLTGPLYDWDDTCLDDSANSAASGTAVVGNDCAATAEQDWTANADGTLEINGLCLYVTGASKNAGALLETADCKPADGGEQWTPQANGTLDNPASGYCAYDPAAGTTGTQLQLATCDTSRAEQWTLPLAGATAAADPMPNQVQTGYCADDYYSGTANGNIIDIYPCNGTSAQDISVSANGSLVVLGGCLTVTGNAITSGTDIELYDCNGDAGQHWIVQSNGSLASVLSQESMCLDDPAAAPGFIPEYGDPTQLTITSCGADGGQSWDIP
jgi:hypothetical protein